MQDITRGTQQKIHLNVLSDGILVQPDGFPLVNIYDADGDNTPLNPYNDYVSSQNTDGTFSVLLTPEVTNINRVLRVVWTYYINAIRFDQEDFYKIETVYSTVSDIIDFLEIGSTPAEINYQSPERITNAEKIARTIINGYTGQKFDTYYGSQEVYGKGGDAVEITEKMINIDKVYENDILLIDNTVDPIFNNFGFGLELSPTGKTVRIVNQGWDVRYDNQVDPAVLYYGRFRDNARYKFTGQIGYKYVPEDIKIASMLLVNDIIANDFNWRNKYLKKVDLSEISFEMAGGAFNGTGNVTVDNILDQYRNINIVII